MPFGTFALISLFYAVIGLRVVRDLWVRRREAFDHRFTEADRYLVDQAAFFILVPVSVALHEFGHAIAIWAFGGKVLDFNYYVFAGSVAYSEPFTNGQHTIVAAAGTVVNLILCALALGVVFFRRPPFRAAINELLFQFAVISGINALIFYPILDVATGMNGDWTQMYDGRAPTLSFAIFVVHAGILIAAYIAWKNPGFRQRLGTLTGMPAAADRRLLGGLRSTAGSPQQQSDSSEGTASFEPASPAEARFRAAADRVARGWAQPVQGRIERRDGWTQVALVWLSGGAQRAVAMRHQAVGPVSISGAVTTAAASTNGRDSATPTKRELRSWPGLPDENDLTMALRVAMEVVEEWQPGTQGESSAR
ncbi:MAG: hypothetical protein QOF01_2098 [Thermomicrobiales bacterium]|jgi:membrane-associated protease RseP (regulator of RpoE activity)|nr:hypothetical protein [Thermomicrobiales bacterium]